MRGKRITYSAVEMAWLEANRIMVISDYHAAFVATFGRDDISALNLHGLRKRKGWKTGREGDRYKGRHRKFSSAEMAWLKENHLLPIAEYHRAFIEAFPREDVRPQNLHALRKRLGWKTGRTGQFTKGNVSHNKGKRCPDGVGGRHPNARKTHFKKGQEPHNTKFLGHERINKDGYIEISVAETNPHTGYDRRYVHKHVHLWTQHNGPVPEGYALKCLDGNKLNTDPSNWEAIPRGVLPRLNGGKATRVMAYDSAPAELKPALLAIAKIDHTIKQKRSSAHA
ncbi:HNH endonuclease signature motif containing protein [Devosia submarina]|uniref:HNH endonuclease signature motif containing protein n=1 Tax=Devosia submarina TaxID=1173082 RepID=UPI001AECC9BE|nr:HNH endonuclease signature motif containing protein [Devosia submarina]